MPEDAVHVAVRVIAFRAGIRRALVIVFADGASHEPARDGNGFVAGQAVRAVVYEFVKQTRLEVVNGPGASLALEQVVIAIRGKGIRDIDDAEIGQGLRIPLLELQPGLVRDHAVSAELECLRGR